MHALINNTTINSLWTGPISGDGSLAIGAVWAACRNFSDEKVEGLSNIYLGSDISSYDSEKEIKNCNNNYKVLDSYDAEDVASWLNQGLIIARCEGKMEFGQRALGNRSILADPRKVLVDKINTK